MAKIKNYFTFLLIFFGFVGLILLTIFWFTNFNYAGVLQSGDFRIHLKQDVVGDQFLTLVSNRFSNNNFVYLSFLPLYSFLRYLPYSVVLIYIFLIIPILLFCSLLFTFLKATHYKFQRQGIASFFFLCSLAFYSAINPSHFNRIGHFTILHSFIFLPLLSYLTYRFLWQKSLVNRYLFLFFLFFYLGGSTPQMVVVNNLVIGAVYIFFLVSRQSFSAFLKKMLPLGIAVFLAQAHIIYPLIIGQGVIKSLRESAITTQVLESLSQKSNIYTAISGTNYYQGLISYPVQFSTGFLIFLLVCAFFIGCKAKKRIDYFLFLTMLLGLIIVTGYRTFPVFYKIIGNTPLHSFLWLIKDPNMYYHVFLIPLLFLPARIVQLKLINQRIIFFLGSLILISNSCFIFLSGKQEYNKFYDSIEVPDYHFTLSEELERLGGRNFWVPYDIYTRKNFSKEIPYFPSPIWWLTENKELTDETEVYRELIEVIEKEISDNHCQNIYFLDFIIATQDLNIVIDQNSINNPMLGVYDTEDKIVQANNCMLKIPHIEKLLSLGNIDVYRSNLEIKNEVYSYQGSIDGLNEFIKKNPVHIVFELGSKEEAKTLDIKDFSILNESLDKNWRDSKGAGSLYKVNLASMLFGNANGNFSYRGAREFQLIIQAQKLAVLLIIFSFFMVKLNKCLRKIFPTIRL